MTSAPPVQMNFSVSVGFLTGFGISGRIVATLLTKLRRETKITRELRSHSASIFPPASSSFFFALSVYEETLTLYARVTCPLPSSFFTPLESRSTETGPGFPALSFANSARSPTLAHFETLCQLGGLKGSRLKWSGSLIMSHDHLCLWRPALP